MEKMKGIDKRDSLINELLQGIEFVKELRSQFMNSSSTNPSSLSSLSSSLSDDNQAPNFLLLEKVLSTFDKTISMAKLLHFQAKNQDNPSINYDNNYGHQLFESPHSLTMSSPNSENSHPSFPPSKRRKSMMPTWSKTVKIGNNEGGVSDGLEGSLDDGFSWRKYGQKEILGAKFPRSYYRCTHRHNRNCVAKKQVQQSDEDPTIHRIVYSGEHTCTQGDQLKTAHSNTVNPAQINSEAQPSLSPQQEVYVGLSPEGDLKVEPEHDLHNRAQIFQCFSFTQAHQQPDPIDDNYILNFSQGFGSPTTSTSNCLPMSPYQATMGHAGLTVQTSETDHDPVSGPNSVTNSPVMGGSDFEFSLGELLDFGGNFSFDFQ